MSEDPKFTVREVTEELPFRWRLTTGSDRNLKVDVGDEFIASDLFGDSPEGHAAQVGADAIMAGCRLMGLTHEEASLSLQLVVRMAMNPEEEK